MPWQGEGVSLLSCGWDTVGAGGGAWKAMAGYGSLRGQAELSFQGRWPGPGRAGLG